jgi:hypothetical protein
MCHGSQITRQEGLKIGTGGLCVVPMRTKCMNDRAAPQSKEKCSVRGIPAKIFLREMRGLGTSLGYGDQDGGCILPKKKGPFFIITLRQLHYMGMNKEKN